MIKWVKSKRNIRRYNKRRAEIRARGFWPVEHAMVDPEQGISVWNGDSYVPQPEKNAEVERLMASPALGTEDGFTPSPVITESATVPEASLHALPPLDVEKVAHPTSDGHLNVWDASRSKWVAYDPQLCAVVGVHLPEQCSNCGCE